MEEGEPVPGLFDFLIEPRLMARTPPTVSHTFIISHTSTVTHNRHRRCTHCAPPSVVRRMVPGPTAHAVPPLIASIDSSGAGPGRVDGAGAEVVVWPDLALPVVPGPECAGEVDGVDRPQDARTTRASRPAALESRRMCLLSRQSTRRR